MQTCWKQLLLLNFPSAMAVICVHDGTTGNYALFFIDYGSGWEDVGIVGVNVHDIPVGKDCASQPDKPLTYVVSKKLDPKTHCCDNPTLPRVHAILSWQWIPPAGART